ncbi:hypothetical protein OIA45_48685 (plasmid) [Streptomyces chartreusis]|uniref:hypothetical protein n=1 Tax=Streptomyces chartreusis TaxID=1969 RepID=UPI0037DC49A0|nr:hypothetical protein OIA45_48685 [Streptomyces chartreusis]
MAQPATHTERPDRQALLRRLEAAVRKGHGVRDTRWQLRQAGLTEDDVWAYELPIRRRIRQERAGRNRTAAAVQRPKED